MPLRVPVVDLCPFCEYLTGRRPYTILDKNSLTATLVTREQRGIGHLLVIPIGHYKTIIDLPTAVAAALMERVQSAARLIRDAFDPDGIAVWQNNGTPAHQSVPHVHFHAAGTLLEGGTNWEPDVPVLPIAETEAIADQLRAGA